MPDGNASSSQLTQQIHDKRLRAQLKASGRKEQIEAQLARKLTECGWRDDVKQKCIEVIEQRGADNVTVDELVHLVAPKGRALVPDALKADMLGTMKDFVASLTL